MESFEKASLKSFGSTLDFFSTFALCSFQSGILSRFLFFWLLPTVPPFDVQLTPLLEADIFVIILNIEENICNEELSIESNPKWDSLNHFQLIASIENEFSIKFDSSEINNITNYSTLLKIIAEKFTEVESLNNN